MTSPSVIDVEVIVTIANDELTHRFGDLVSGVGATLAEAVSSITEQERLGYYPALSFFQQREDFDQAMLDSAMHIYQMVCDITRETVRANLRTLLKNIEVSQLQAIAETLPRVRPGQVDAVRLLAKHYSPSTIRLHVTGEPRETVEGFPSPDAVTRYMQTLLGEQFLRVDVTDIRRA
jgi:hypothetical protein